MEIAVIGGGHGCYAAAVELTEKGHNVRLWRRDAAALQPVIDKGAIEIKDRNGVREIAINTITAELSEAVTGAQLLVMPLPATTHESLAPQISPLLEDGQVVFFPPGTFASYIFARALKDSGNGADVSFCETGTLPYLARKHSPTSVVVSGYATRLPTGVLPERNSDHAFNILEQAYPSVERAGNALSGALMNAGGIIHPPLIIMNAGPLEHFDKWDIHNEGTQPSIRRVTDALDQERIAVREALDYAGPHFPLRDHYVEDGDEWMYGRRAHDELTDSGDWREDIDLTSHRYMLEDLRLGLSLIASVGKLAGVPTPIASGLLAIGSAVTGRDLYAEGRTLEKLGLADLSLQQLQHLLETGL
jgi:opine dehydrogenase